MDEDRVEVIRFLCFQRGFLCKSLFNVCLCIFHGRNSQRSPLALCFLPGTQGCLRHPHSDAGGHLLWMGLCFLDFLQDSSPETKDLSLIPEYCGSAYYSLCLFYLIYLRPLHEFAKLAWKRGLYYYLKQDFSVWTLQKLTDGVTFN